VDPGTRCTGWGIVELRRQRLRVVDYGVIRTRTSDSLQARLSTIADGLAEVLRRQQPDAAAVESLFAARNASSALKLGHARGAVLLTLAQAGLDAADYAPSQVKQAVVGTGRGTKEQVQQMVKVLLALPETPASDAADALAVAVCHLTRFTPPHRGRTSP